MNQNKFFAKIEILFWDVWIHLLSDSRWVRKSVKNAYHLAQREELNWLGRMLAIAAVSGLFFGITFYILIFYLTQAF